METLLLNKNDILGRWKDKFHELLSSMEQEQEPPTVQNHEDTNEE